MCQACLGWSTGWVHRAGGCTRTWATGIGGALRDAQAAVDVGATTFGIARWQDRGLGDSTVARAGFHSSISRPAHLRAVGPIGMPELDVSRCERHWPHRLVAINFTTFKLVAQSRGFGFLQAARVEQHRGGELQAPGARTARSAPRPAAPRASPRERRASPGPGRAGVTVPRPAAAAGAQGQYCPVTPSLRPDHPLCPGPGPPRGPAAPWCAHMKCAARLARPCSTC